MAPTAVAELSRSVDIADLKAKVINDHVELEKEPKLPVADNYMYDFQYNHALPTIESLGQDVSEDVDAVVEAQTLVDRLETTLGSGDAQGFTDLFLDYGKCIVCIRDVLC